MPIHTRFLSAAFLPVALFAVSAFPTLAAVSGTKNHVAPVIQSEGQDLGQESPSTILHLSAWLNVHNKADLDAKVAALYAKDSPAYHHWLTPNELKSFGSTEPEVAAVKRELAAHNLTITSIDPWNLSIRFSGKSSDVEAAFNTTIRRVQARSEMVHISSSTPALSGAAIGLVSHVGGLGSLSMKAAIRRPINPNTHEPIAPRAVARTVKSDVKAANNPADLPIPSQCFNAPETINVSGTEDGHKTIAETATYTGLTYGSSINGQTGNNDNLTCSYAPSDLATIYGLNNVYAKGIKGEGQNIVIIDPYLEPYIQADMDTFTSSAGIPDVTIKALNPFGTITNGALTEWGTEADLDTQVAHSIAPAAGITLLEAYSPDAEELQYAVLYAVENQLGNVISNSYGSQESFASNDELDTWSEVNEFAAASGVAVQYSSGDDGDFSQAGFFVQPPDVDVPADTPYATAVGGTSVSLLSDGGFLTTGWGNNSQQISVQQGRYLNIYNPDAGPSAFTGGSGGGTSAYFTKPSYQAYLPGTGRLLPDVSALADPYTGVQVIYSQDGITEYSTGVGGTSVATPIFSAIWSLVDEAYGKSVGFAAPLVADFSNTPYIADVLPFTGPANVTGSLTTPTGTTTFSTTDLVVPLYSTTQFATAIWNTNGNEYAVISFGTDTSLTVTQGWDNVTGYGTINLTGFSEVINSLK